MIYFMKHKTLYLIISSLVIIPGLVSLLLNGLKPSIDFTGGTLIELKVNPDFQDIINQTFISDMAKQNNIEIASILLAENSTFIIKAKPITQQTNSLFQENIASASGVATPSAVLTENRFETLGPTLGAETLKRALAAIGLAAVGILLFVWWRFKDKKYGVCAILAMFHDTLVVFGIFSILGYLYHVEIDTLFMTAVLTILSFSVHDTIVVYDRIRESLRNLPGKSFELVVDKAINETLGRSVNNSMTIVFMLLSLYLLGGETTKWFVLTLLIGTISGTYSSPFVAAPLLVLWGKYFKK